MGSWLSETKTRCDWTDLLSEDSYLMNQTRSVCSPALRLRPERNQSIDPFNKHASNLEVQRVYYLWSKVDDDVAANAFGFLPVP